MIGVGIIGAGVMGQAHAESVSILPNTQLLAVMDTDPIAAQTVTSKFGGEAVPSAEALVSRNDIQVVVIATPTPFHYAHAKSALEHGKHVFVEMPFVRNVHEGEELIEFAKQKNLIISVDHLLRFYKEFATIKEKFDGGATGKPGMIRLSRQTPHPKKWYSNFESSGGVVLDAMCHEFDFLLWCIGDVQRIFCRGLHGKQSTESMDYALASIRMQNGAVAHIESSWSHRGQYNLAVEVAGNEGLIQYKNKDSVPMELSLLNGDAEGRSYFTESPVIYPAQYLLFKEFVDAVNGTGKNPVSGEEGLAAVRCSLAAIESMQTNKPVTLS
jgi:predicted dehydrogenase